MKCAGFGDLIFLSSGDAALTRRATALSARHAVVVKFSRARKRNERQGILVEAQDVECAKVACDADEGSRAAVCEKRRVRDRKLDEAYKDRFTGEILRLFPGCPPEEAREIALHACELSAPAAELAGGRCAASLWARKMPSRRLAVDVDRRSYDVLDVMGAANDLRDAVHLCNPLKHHPARRQYPAALHLTNVVEAAGSGRKT